MWRNREVEREKKRVKPPWDGTGWSGGGWKNVRREIINDTVDKNKNAMERGQGHIGDTRERG